MPDRKGTAVNYPELERLSFHSSTVEIREVDVSAGAEKKDFGRGFYTTSSKTQRGFFGTRRGASCLRLGRYTELELADELIQATVNNITGYIVASVAKRQKRKTEDVFSEFLRSKTYILLQDKDTGMYWDSISETMDRYLAEVEPLP